MKIVALLAALFAWVFGWLGKQDRIREEQQAEKKAEDDVDVIRADVHAMPDDQLHRETDRWTKP